MKIACFHMNQVGDFVFSIPLLKSLRETYPDAHITSVARPFLKGLFEMSGLVDDLILRPKAKPLADLQVIRELRNNHCDLGVLISQSPGNILLAYCGGVKRRVGFSHSDLPFLLTEKVEFENPPSVYNNLKMAEYLCGKINCNSYYDQLKVDTDLQKRADEILGEVGIPDDAEIAAFAPGTSKRRSTKEWLSEGYAAVGEYLASRNIRTVLLGNEDHSDIISECPKIYDLGNKTSLEVACAILKRSRFILAVDSGLLHLAGAVGTRAIGLYGPTDPTKTGPQGPGQIILTSNQSCSPCMKPTCPFQMECMKSITVESVLQAVKETLNNSR